MPLRSIPYRTGIERTRRSIHYQTERIEQAMHVARYTAVVRELAIVDFVDELCDRIEI